jgi:hypothetical protein
MSLRSLRSPTWRRNVCGAVAVLLVASSSAQAGGVPTHRPVAPPFLKGIDVFLQDDSTLSDAQLAVAFAPTMAAAKATGATAVSLAFPIFQRNLRANTIGAGFGTPSPHRLGIFIDVARAAHLKVLIRPLLDEFLLRPGWRGVIAPTKPVAWLSHYSSFIAPYLDVARRHGVATVQLSSELNSLASQPRWRDVVRRAHRHFPGEVQFTSGMYPTSMTAPPRTTFGIDFYHPVAVAPTAQPATIARAMEGLLRRFPGPRPLAETTLSEVGIRSQAGAFAEPAATHLSGPPSPQRLDPSVQARWFTAACDVAHRNGMRGIFYWALFYPGPALPPPNVAYPARFSRPGLAAIKRCFARTTPNR